MDQRISFVTLAVRDLAASRAFYLDGLGWHADVEVPGEVPGIAEGPTLRRGDSGLYVRVLQEALGIPVDAVFGPVTERSVRAFQARAGLVVDGVVGPKTRRALAERGGSGA